MTSSFGLGFAAVACGVFLLIAVPAANAQTMGEYGMQTGAAAANAQGAGSSLGSAIRNQVRMPSGGNNRSGGSHTVMIPDSGGEYARSTTNSRHDSTHAGKADSHNNEKADSHNHHKKTSADNAPWRGNWVRVR